MQTNAVEISRMSSSTNEILVSELSADTSTKKRPSSEEVDR